MASSKSLDNVYKVEPPSAGKKLRELFYMAHYVHSHIAHFYALAAPDFVMGPDADPTVRNILGVVSKVGVEIGGEVIKHRAFAQRIQEVIGGKATHPVFGLPGGVSRAITEEERKDFEEKAKSILEFSKFSLKIFDDVVLKEKKYLDLVTSPSFMMKSYYMGLVDEKNKVNFYDGKLRIIDPDGKEFAKFNPSEYLTHIAEHVEPWSYLKFPFLKKLGWKGFVDGKASGVYRVAPLARLNVSDGMATPLAQEAYDKMYETLGGKPSHHTLAMHWARLVELVFAAERLLQLCTDPEITSPHVRNIPTEKPGEGVGVVEAPRGALVHHYISDENGIARKINLIVATGHNYAAMNMSIKSAARAVIRKDGQITQGLLNMVEMAFRAYDPCFGCATHALPGNIPLEIDIYDGERRIISSFKRE